MSPLLSSVKRGDNDLAYLFNVEEAVNIGFALEFIFGHQDKVRLLGSGSTLKTKEFYKIPELHEVTKCKTVPQLRRTENNKRQYFDTAFRSQVERIRGNKHQPLIRRSIRAEYVY